MEVVVVVIARVIWVEREGREIGMGGIVDGGGGAAGFATTGKGAAFGNVVALAVFGFDFLDLLPSIDLEGFNTVNFVRGAADSSSSNQVAVSKASDEGGIGGSESGRPRLERLTPVLSV